MHSIRRRIPQFAPLLLAGALLLTAETVQSQTLRGSAASLDRQNEQARAHAFTYLRTPDQVRQFVAEGYLVPVRPNRDFDVHNVSFPYARPEVRLFIERLASQYRASCGEKLVVTSLTRPTSNQPANASSRSVHPTGMAVDLRRSGNARCRSWLESTLLSLESRGLVEAIYERNPPHYHIAVYPRPYAQYVASVTGNERVVDQVAQADPELRVEWVSHRVARGENLTSIARRYDASVSRIRAENGIQGSRIMAGQSLRIPVYREVPVQQAPTRVAQAEEAADAQEADAAEDTGDGAPDLDSGQDDGDASAATASTGSAAARSSTRSANGDEVVHRVARGESLWTISRLYGVSEAELRRANGISGSRILVGQELAVPGASAPSAGQVLSHRVARGESLWTIARRHGISVDDIRRHNGIGSTRIYAGQVLEVPVGG